MQTSALVKVRLGLGSGTVRGPMSALVMFVVREVSGTAQLNNASAYRPLSAFKTQEITGSLRRDTMSFAAYLF